VGRTKKKKKGRKGVRTSFLSPPPSGTSKMEGGPVHLPSPSMPFKKTKKKKRLLGPHTGKGEVTAKEGEKDFHNQNSMVFEGPPAKKRKMPAFSY